VIVYVDSSVLLRLVLSQRGALAQWPAVRRGVASALVEVECLRSIDRLRIAGLLNDNAVAERRQAVFRLLTTLDIVDLDRVVLARAAQPLPTTLGTLDAIHLATAALWRERTDPELVMATHDASMATAARAIGMDVVGV
jgi:predicted nucleic acid-binding protein